MTIALSCTSLLAQAQMYRKLTNNRPTAVKLMKRERMHAAILRQALGTGRPATAAKTTSTVTDERLIAQSTYNWYDATGGGIYVWTKTDSAQHKYSGEHGSKFNFNNMSFDPYYNIYSTMFLGQGVTIGMGERDNKPGILSDSSLYYYQYSADTVEPFEMLRATYNSANCITEYQDEYMPFSYAMRNLLTFNTSNRPTSVLYTDNGSGTGWDSLEHRILAYTGDTLSFDSTAAYNSVSWDPEYKFTYTYDATGKATRISLWTYDGVSAFYESDRYDFDYYTTNNKLKQLTYSTSDGTSPMEIQEVDSVGWSTSGIMSTLQNLYYAGGVPDSKYLQAYHITGAGMPDTIYTSEFYDLTVSTPDVESATAWTYDAYNNPVTSIGLVRTTPTSTFDSVTNTGHYYYETYTRDATKVNEVKSDIAVKLYPNPVSNQLLIMQTADNTQVTKATIFNAMGQQVSNASGQGTIAIDMSHLPTGTYLVMLQDAQGNMVHREKVVKL